MTSRLSRDEVVRAALRVARREGIDGVTMRRLAEELGVSVAAAYYYVEGRDELLRLVTDEVVGAVTTSHGERVDWEGEMRAWSRETFRAIDAYPGLYGMMATRGFTESARRSIDELLGALLDAGYDERTAAQIYILYLSYLLGAGMLEDNERKRGKKGAGRPLGRFAREDGKAYPVLLRIAKASEGLKSEDFLDFGVDTIIAGVRALQQQGVPKTTRKRSRPSLRSGSQKG